MKSWLAVAAGLAAGAAVERLVVRKPWREDPYRYEGFGAQRGEARWVRADEGTHLYAEVHPAAPDAPTIVIAHGYCLTQDSWHFQRKALRGRARLVLWDQRGHGSSERGPSQNNTIDQLGRDMHSVIEALTDGPLTVVGHSMGGMTVMALADQFPELVQSRVTGVGLVATSSGDLSMDFARLPAPLRSRLEAGISAHQPGRVPLASLIEQVRRTDLNYALTRRGSFGSQAPVSLNDFMIKMVNGTTMETVLDFLPTLMAHDKTDALKVLQDVPAFITCGELDVLTPPSHSHHIAGALPDARTTILPETGHMIQLERPEHVTREIERIAFPDRP